MIFRKMSISPSTSTGSTRPFCRQPARRCPAVLGFYQALDLVESAARGRNVKGIDVVELAPVSGQPVSDFTAALISYHLMRIALDT